MQIKFPSSFLWGAALSSYQCEGGNFNCDWYVWEKEKALEPAGSACDHYSRFQDDFQLAKKLNLSTLRFSIEWSRICPRKEVFLKEEIGHYVEVVESLIRNNLKPIVTLHHFTNPNWFLNSGGWSCERNTTHFITYLKKVVEALKDKVDTWLIFNEPMVYLYNSFISGIWPPGEKSLPKAKKVIQNIINAYCIGYEEIHRIYENISKPVNVSLAKNIRIFCPCPNSIKPLSSISVFLRNKYFNFWLLELLHKKKYLDFIGLNYYCREYDKFKGLLGAECGHKFHQEKQNYLGWDIDPQGFYEALLKLKKFNLPIIITENGTAENKNYLYEDFLITHLGAMAKAYSQGVDIAGYLWWSLLDNFEWDKGFAPRFGLVRIDYKTMKRDIKPFAYKYARIAKENKIEI